MGKYDKVIMSSGNFALALFLLYYGITAQDLVGRIIGGIGGIVLGYLGFRTLLK